jgi:hypothetical protein
MKGSNMTYSLFIDDERDPVDVAWGTWQERELYRTGDWIIARNWPETLELIINFGMPNLISFDHDLGNDTINGYEISKRLCDFIMDAKYILPEDFRFLVHSKNPVGAENIRCYMENFLKAYEHAKKVPDKTDLQLDDIIRRDVGYEEENDMHSFLAGKIKW